MPFVRRWTEWKSIDWLNTFDCTFQFFLCLSPDYPPLHVLKGRIGMTPKTILIVGAGIGGLTAAIALRRQGFTVEMVETATENVEFKVPRVLRMQDA